MIIWGIVIALICLSVYTLGLADGTWQLRSANKYAGEIEERERLVRYQQDGEPFNSLCNCPKCKALEVHWIEVRSKFAIPRDGSIRRQCRTCGFKWKQW